MSPQVDLIIKCNKWSELSMDLSQIAHQCLKLIISKFTQDFDKINICVLLTSNTHMKKLNANYRSKDKPTNVLSFAEFKIDPDKIHDFIERASLQFNGNIYLGTLALGYQIIAQEAQNYHISFRQHYTHLIVHGILHLLGFDHETQQDAQVMEPLEQIILSNLQQNIVTL